MRGMQQAALPIRVWLGLALVAVVGVPLAFMLGTAALAAQGTFRQFPYLDEVRTDVVRDVSRWGDPTWQADLTARLAGKGVAVVLRDANGTFVYGSGGDMLVPPFADARPLPTPEAGPGQPGPQTAEPPLGQPLPPARVGFAQPISRVTVTQNDRQIGTAYFVLADNERIQPRDFTPNAWQLLLFEASGPSRTQVAFAGLLAFVLTTLAAAWLVGRAVLVPLAAMGAAAHRIAGGDLDFDLPPARVSEVAEVGAAFRAMAAGLRASVYRQADVESERRLFITAIVHDLRTPLFSLRGYLEGLATGVAKSPERVADYLAVCREKVAMLDRLVSDLFTYSRLEYLEQVPERAALDLNDLLPRVAEGFGLQCAAREITLTLEASADPCPLEGDEHLLRRAVENLLDNATRYTPSGGTITLRWSCEPAGAHFSVADTGPGVNPADLPHLFAPMFRGESSRNRETGGAGLGLTIARRVLLAHGGDLVAANQPGGGAIFTGTIPADSSQPPAVSRQQKAATGAEAVAAL